LQTVRKRAPSVRSLETRKRILDAAEQIFSNKGYEGASLRKIATFAEVPVGLVHHHGSSKEELFAQTVRRRAQILSEIRLNDLKTLKAKGEVTLPDLLDCFFRAFVKLLNEDGAHWHHYGRLIAHVSSDPRWRPLAEECFDPTAKVFLDEIARLFPHTDLERIATGLIYSVSALLAFFNASWRIDTLSPGAAAPNIEDLVQFCSNGIAAMMEK
jgi:AcrR family transcriptional regulator